MTNPTRKFFGETAYFNTAEEKQDAYKYLELWKKYLIIKLKKDSFDVTITDEQMIERPPWVVSCLAQCGTLSLKLCVEADWHYELKPY